MGYLSVSKKKLLSFRLGSKGVRFEAAKLLMSCRRLAQRINANIEVDP